MSIFERFARGERGNVAIIFALAVVPVIGAVGAAVDYSRISEIRSKIANAADAGVLAVGSMPPMPDKDAYDTVNSWIKTHTSPEYDQYWTLNSVTQSDDGKIVAVISGDVDMTIARILGVTEVPLKITSEAVRSIGKVEVAMVLDNTGSMRGTKIAKLKDAADALVNSLVTATTKPEDLKIGLVPFSQTVNVGSQYDKAAWLDADGKSDSAKSQFLGQEVNRLDLFKAVGTTWGGCVETRANSYEATETAASPADPNSLYVPYFAPDEPGSRSDNYYVNSYLDDTPLKTVKDNLTTLGLTAALGLPDFRLLQSDVLKYKGTPRTGTTKPFGYAYGPNSGCEIAPLMRLTSNSARVKTAIGTMIANGNTDIGIGASWGWNLLSDKGPFGDGVAYGTPDWTKIMVLMTDGNNENAVGNSKDESYYSGIGYVWQDRMGVPPDNTSQWERTKARDKRLGEICSAMKEKGIVIYTIRVEVRYGSSDVLQNCASEKDNFYDVDNVAQLTETFQKIGSSIQKLRLAR